MYIKFMVVFDYKPIILHFSMQTFSSVKSIFLVVYLDFKISSLEIVHTEIKVSPIVHNTDIPDSVITYLLFWNILAD